MLRQGTRPTASPTEDALDPKEQRAKSLETAKKGGEIVAQGVVQPIIADERSKDAKTLLTLLHNHSFKHSAIPKFPLASGRMSEFYVDCKTALSYAKVRELIGSLIAGHDWVVEIDGVGGLELGAYPIALSISDACYRRQGRDVKAFVIRKQPKGHGLKKWLEGDIREGERVLIVDDVVTSGQSTLTAIERSRDEGLTVVGAIAVIDREEGASENFAKAKVPFCSLFKLSDLVSVGTGDIQ